MEKIEMNYRISLQNLIGLLMIGTGTLFAQDEEGMEEQSAIIVSATEEMDGSSTATRVMAFNTGDMAGGPLFFADSFAGSFEFSAGIAGDSFSMLNNPSVQKDLQLVDEQMQQIKEINREFGEKIKNRIEELKDGSNGSLQSAGLGQLIEELKQQQQEQIQSILLPNQQQRLDQVARQMKLRHLGTAQTLTSHLAKELELTAEQQARIESRAKELQQEITAKMADLKAKAKEDLLNELTRDQRKKLEELVGDEFVEKEEDSQPGVRRIMKPQPSIRKDF